MQRMKSLFSLAIIGLITYSTSFAQNKVAIAERYISNIVSGKVVQVEFPILGKSIGAKVRQAGNFINDRRDYCET